MPQLARVPSRHVESASSEWRVGHPAQPWPAAAGWATASILSLRRTIGTRAFGALVAGGSAGRADTPAEQQFAFTHDGQVESVEPSQHDSHRQAPTSAESLAFADPPLASEIR